MKPPKHQAWAGLRPEAAADGKTMSMAGVRVVEAADLGVAASRAAAQATAADVSSASCWARSL